MLQLEYLDKRLSSSYFWSLFFLDFLGNIVLPRKCGMVTWKIPGSTSHNFQAPVQTKPSGNSASWFRIFSDNLSTSKLVGSSRAKTSGFFKGGRVGTANGKLPSNRKLPWLSHEWAMKRAVVSQFWLPRPHSPGLWQFFSSMRPPPKNKHYAKNLKAFSQASFNFQNEFFHGLTGVADPPQPSILHSGCTFFVVELFIRELALKELDWIWLPGSCLFQL